MGDMLVLGGVIILWALWAAALIWWDVNFQRLPDPLTVPPAGAAFIAALIVNPWFLLGLVWPVLYVLTGLIVGGVGGGDIKLAVSLGILLTAYAGVGAVIIAMILASLLSIAVGVTKTVVMATKNSQMPHGPSMIIATIGVATISAF